MRLSPIFITAGLALLPLAFWGDSGVRAAGQPEQGESSAAEQPGAAAGGAGDPEVVKHWGLLENHCFECHNYTDWAGGVAFDTMLPEAMADEAEVWEEVVRKLRGRLMPPADKPQPDAEAVKTFVAAVENHLDRAAARNPNPGTVALHRLNRTEYANAVEEILGVKVHPAALLPRDDKSAGFDNVAEVLKISPSFLEQYISAARQVSMQALGNPSARLQSKVYSGAPGSNQYMHIEGLPLGTRGGMVIEHYFPVGGEYRITIEGLVGAGYVWGVLDENTLIVTVDDAKVFERKLGGREDLDAVDLEQAVGVGRINDRFKDIPVQVTAGRHRIGIAFLEKTAAESNEILHSFVPVAGMAVHVNGNSDGPRIGNVEIKGPIERAGVSDTPSRKKILTCRPATPAEERPCAEDILSNMARKAFRRPVTERDLAGPMAFFEEGRTQGGFDTGIQKGLMAILSSPKFLYRAHTVPEDAKPGTTVHIADRELASRLSFFLWSRPPDDELLELAGKGRLSDPRVLEKQVRRMLADPRARSLVTNFAFQWLHVEGLELVDPDPDLFPEYTEDLIHAFEHELELFIASIFDADRSVVDLMTADHTFVNERLALHYGLKDVRGGQFRRVRLEESYRYGLLGKGAFLMATSYANRTTPVLRGAYILEKFFGTPPAAPPPDVEAFPETEEGGVALSVRERLEMHRELPSCNSCHGAIDPLGLALENFDAIGRWREVDIDAGTPIDASGRLVDGTAVNGPDDLRRALTEEPEQFVQTFTENLMTFALGRRVQYYDMPTVRSIVRNAAKEDYRLSAIVLGIVSSPAFRMERVPAPEEVEQALSAVRDTQQH